MGMLETKVFVANLKEVQQSLNRIAVHKDRKAIVRKAARSIMTDLRNKTRALAPKKKGTLKRNIRVRTLKRSRVSIGANVLISKSRWKYKSKLWEVYYAPMVEYGSERQKAQHFMRRAADTYGKGMQQKFLTRIEHMIYQRIKVTSKQKTFSFMND